MAKRKEFFGESYWHAVHCLSPTMMAGGKGTFLRVSRGRGASGGPPLRDFVSEDTVIPRIRNSRVKKLILVRSGVGQKSGNYTGMQ